VTARLFAHPHLAERTEDKRREVAFLGDLARQHRARLDQALGELELAREELAALEAQAGLPNQALAWCAVCGTYHQPATAPCPPLLPCPDCHAERCRDWCPNRLETPDAAPHEDGED
jgi:hypothetical protein